jgi:hypothetical protein
MDRPVPGLTFHIWDEWALFEIIDDLCHTARHSKTACNKETSMSAVPESFLGAAANDADAQETREWLDALAAVIATEGEERAHYLLER